MACVERQLVSHASPCCPIQLKTLSNKLLTFHQKSLSPSLWWSCSAWNQCIACCLNIVDVRWQLFKRFIYLFFYPWIELLWECWLLLLHAHGAVNIKPCSGQAIESLTRFIILLLFGPFTLNYMLMTTEVIYILASLKLTIKLYLLHLITTKMFTVRYVWLFGQIKTLLDPIHNKQKSYLI